MGRVRTENEWVNGIAKNLDIPIIGYADVNQWDMDELVSANVPAECRPLSIMPEAKSAIVIGMPVQMTVLQTAPSIYYRELYVTLNNLLDVTAQRVVNILTMGDYKAVYIPRDGYHGIRGLMKEPTSFFSHKHAAYLAGLGTFGVNNTLLTEKYGPRVRITTVLTDAVFDYGEPMKKDLCIKCLKCRDACPAGAIGDDLYPVSKVDKVRCTDNSVMLSKHGISPCGRCIAICPVGNDRVMPPTEEATENIRHYRLD